MNARFMPLEVKFNSKLSVLKAYLIGEIYEIKNKIELLHDENGKVKPDAGKSKEIDFLKLKVEFLEKENYSLKNEINSKQNLIDSILKNNSNY